MMGVQAVIFISFILCSSFYGIYSKKGDGLDSPDSYEYDAPDPETSYAKEWWDSVFDASEYGGTGASGPDLLDGVASSAIHFPLPLPNTTQILSEELRRRHGGRPNPPDHHDQAGDGGGGSIEEEDEEPRLHGEPGSVCPRRVMETRCGDRRIPYPCWKWKVVDCRSCGNDCRREGRTCRQMKSDTCFHTESKCVAMWVTKFNCCPSYEELDSGLCSRIDHCGANNGNCEQICRSDGPDSHRCECFDGFSIGHYDLCQDINECAFRNGGCNHHCINTKGSFYCQCRNGYSLDPTTGQCREIDECAIENGGCMHGCVNTIGAFYCKCKAGYQLVDGFKCSVMVKSTPTPHEITSLPNDVTATSVPVGGFSAAVLQDIPMYAGVSIVVILILCATVGVTIWFLRRKSHRRSSHASTPSPSAPSPSKREASAVYQPNSRHIDNYGYEVMANAQSKPQPTPPPTLESPPSYLEATAPALEEVKVTPNSTGAGPVNDRTYEPLQLPHSDSGGPPKHVYDNLAHNASEEEEDPDNYYMEIVPYDNHIPTSSETERTNSSSVQPDQLAQAMRNLKKVKK